MMDKPIHLIVDSFPLKEITLTDQLGAFLTPLIAIITIFIAYQQSKNNLKLELFDRRKKVFIELQDFIGNIVTSGQVSPEACHTFYNNMVVDRNLFMKSDQEYFIDVYERALDLWKLNSQLYDKNGNAINMNDINSRHNTSQKILELSIWIAKQFDEIPLRFSKYFNIGTSI